MVPSVSGPTACAVWQSATQARNAEARTGGIVVLKLISVFIGVLIFSCMVSERLVGFERLITVGRVEGAGGVAIERSKTSGRVSVGGVEVERSITVGSVLVADCIVRQRIS